MSLILFRFIFVFIQNDISFLRLRSKKHEIMIAPDKDYTLIVVQNPYADRDKN